MKWCTCRAEDFDISYAQIGAEVAKLRDLEQSNLDQKISGLRKKSGVRVYCSRDRIQIGIAARKPRRRRRRSSSSPEELVAGAGGGGESGEAAGRGRGDAGGGGGDRGRRRPGRRRPVAGGGGRLAAARRGDERRRGSGRRRRRRAAARGRLWPERSAGRAGPGPSRAGDVGAGAVAGGPRGGWRLAGRGGGHCPACPDTSVGGGSGEDDFFLGFRGEGEIRKRRGVYIGIEGARRVQMRCGFRPHDRDRTL